MLVKDGDDPGEVAAALLRAAAPDKWRVRKVTAGRRQAFEVPDDVYEAFAAEHGLDEQEPPHDPPTTTEGPGRTDDPASAVTPPLVSGEPVIETGADDGLAGSRGEAPDRNDKTEDWQRFMRPVLGDAVDGMKRSELIAAHDNEDA
ncbi:hypothetical protein SEA_RIBEYE_23 [Gordonia phage Ribeye]|uniref:Uncharacterized protein n=1 Tax=Gordonia phage Ribeye TaxID=2250417 RepID=A0A345KPD4_9CAUD|nr:hypothetical protein J1768_gp23 [Gordonia phage Ribeye]AXH44886.1 hypothetical protein SEA_RIBEYE_23 [Gordonia phage Ribeye]